MVFQTLASRVYAGIVKIKKRTCAAANTHENIYYMYMYTTTASQIKCGEEKCARNFPPHTRRSLADSLPPTPARQQGGGGIEEKEILLLSTSTNSLVSYTRSRPSRPVAVASKPSS